MPPRREFCSDSCKTKFYVSSNRRKMKARAVEYKGGKCIKCGYNRCLSALTFHHPDDNKEFGISRAGACRSWDKIKAEIDKCELLCSNCHAEEHEHLNIGV